MSPSPSPESNGPSFPDFNTPRSSEDTDMQSVPEIIVQNPAGVEIPVNHSNQIVRRQLQSFLRRRAIERAENPDLVEPRSDRATNTTVNSTALSTLGRSSQRRQRPGNSAFRAIARDLNILSLDGTIDLRFPTLGEEVQAVATPGMDIISQDGAMDTQLPTIDEEIRAVAPPGLELSSRVQELRRVQRLRRLYQSRRRGITRSPRERRNAMDSVSVRPASPILRRPSFNTSRSRSNRTNNLNADDEAVDMNPPVSDPATNLDNFTARRNVRSRSALSIQPCTGGCEDLDYEQREISGMTDDLIYDSAPIPEFLQRIGRENPSHQRRSARQTYTTPVNADSPSVASISTSTSTSNSTTEPTQSQATATGNGNTTVSSRKLSQSATVRLWVAMYQTNDKKQQDRETMREEGVDGIPISNLSIGAPPQR